MSIRGLNRRLLGLTAAFALAIVPMVAAAQGLGTQWSATLSGANEIPAVTTSAGGSFSSILDETNQTLTWNLQAGNITGITAAHLHNATAGNNGPVVVNLYGGATVNSLNISGVARPADLVGPFATSWPNFVAAIKSGSIYVNVHTTANPNGEIRGQVMTQQIPPTATAAPKVTATATSTAPVPSAPKTGNAGMTGDSPLVAAAGVGLLALLVVVGGRYAVSRRS